jgi:uncharacterized OB-fold protein
MSEPRLVYPGLFSVDAQGAGYLIGGWCAACRRSHFPRLTTCPYCSAADCSEHVLPGEGALYLYTAVLNRPPAYQGDVPFGFGVVELDDGLRVLTRLTESNLTRLRSGMRMRLVFTPVYRDDEGRDVLSYAFAPSGGSDGVAGGAAPTAQRADGGERS